MWNRQVTEIRYAAMCIRTLEWRHNERDGVSDHQRPHCLLNCWFGCRSKKTSKHRVTGLYAVNSPMTGEFLAEMASDTENVSIWWRHHKYTMRTIQYIIQGLIVISYLAIWPDLCSECSDPFEIWHVSCQYCCQDACQIPKWYDNFNYRCPDLETSRDCTIYFADTETGHI